MLQEMMGALEQLGDGETVFYISSTGFVPKSSEYYYDLFHRTDAGRKLFAAKLASALREKVIERAAPADRPGDGKGNE